MCLRLAFILLCYITKQWLRYKTQVPFSQLTVQGHNGLSLMNTIGVYLPYPSITTPQQCLEEMIGEFQERRH